jgi:hypothetical protein
VEVEAQQDDHDGAAMVVCWLPCTVLSSRKQSTEHKVEETKVTSNWAIIASQLTSGKKIRDKNAKLLLCSFKEQSSTSELGRYSRRGNFVVGD